MTQNQVDFSDSGGNSAEIEPPSRSVPPLDFLSTDRVIADLCVASRKRLFEALALLISEKSDIEIGLEEVFKTLNDRERLGSTALGKGIALPHGRVDGLASPVIAVVRLQNPIDYDAPDGEPVWLAVCLLVPKEANEVHLNLLSKLAAGFHNENFVMRVKEAPTSSALYHLFTEI